MKISEYKNEEALDLLADIIEPAGEILSDESIKKAYNGKIDLKLVSAIVKAHKKEVLKILARLDNTPVSEYECNIFTLPFKLLEILSDKELINFFNLQAQRAAGAASESAMANTEVTEIT